MPKVGFKFSPESIQRLRIGHLGQIAWNKGKKFCKHPRKFYKRTPKGVPYCLLCARRNNAKYRDANRKTIRANWRLRRYKLTSEHFEGMWKEQKGRCAICLRRLHRHIKKGKLRDGYRIDHDPRTGEVRGLLCHSCNTGIGLLGDSVFKLQRGIRYLNNPTAKRIRHAVRSSR